MSYALDVLALDTSLVGFWLLNEPADNTLAIDSSANALNLTYANPKVSGPELITGVGASMLSETGGASATIAGGTALANMLTAGTVGLWVTPNSAAFTGGMTIASTPRWSIRTAGNSGGVAWGGGVHNGDTVIQVGNPALFGTTPIAAGNAHFLAWTWDGKETALWTNGVRDATIMAIGGQLSGAAGPLSILSSVAAGVAVSGVFIANRALTGGELRALYLTGTKVAPPVESRHFDFQYTTLPHLNAPEALPCAACTGRMSTVEPVIDDGINAGKGRYHVGCATLRRVGRPYTVIGPGATPTQIGRESLRHIFDQMTIWLHRHGPGKPRYLGATNLVHSDFTTQPPALTNAPRLASAAAQLAYVGQVPEDHWTIDVCKNLVDLTLRDQLSNGLFFSSTIVGGPAFQFALEALLDTRLCLSKMLDERTLTEWDRALELAGMYLQTQPTGFPEKNYYVNGNIEVLETGIYWRLWRITGKQVWLDRFEAQLAFAVSPPNPAPSGSNAAGMGYVELQSGTAADWSDRRGYFTEKGSGEPGLDWNYTMVQADMMAGLIAAGCTDPRILRYTNALTNQVLTRVNTTNGNIVSTVNGTDATLTPWQFDARGGSRQNSVPPVFVGSSHIHLSLKGFRPDFSADWPGAHWAKFFPYDGRNARGLSSRFDIIGGLLRWVSASPLWVTPQV